MRTEDIVGYSHLERYFFPPSLCLLDYFDVEKNGHISNLVMLCALCDPHLNQALFNNGRLRWKPCSVACFWSEWSFLLGSFCSRKVDALLTWTLLLTIPDILVVIVVACRSKAMDQGPLTGGPQSGWEVFPKHWIFEKILNLLYFSNSNFLNINQLSKLW